MNRGRRHLPGAMRLLVVEDHAPLRRALVRGLCAAGYAVDEAGDGAAGLYEATEGGYDAIVLDLMLPGLDGLSLLSRYRSAGGDAPVLVLTARDTIEDRVQGLDRGADDYLVKPFAFEELLARVRALVRRHYAAPSPRITVGDLVIDTAARIVTRAGRSVELTAREYGLLELLAMRRGEVVTRNAIWEHLWDLQSETHSNVVDVYIGYLRRKLEEDGAARLIHTRRGIGYVLQAGEEA